MAKGKKLHKSTSPQYPKVASGSGKKRSCPEPSYRGKKK
jgi:hypothetical protein